MNGRIDIGPNVRGQNGRGGSEPKPIRHIFVISRHFEGFKRCTKHQRCKINFNTAECINMYVKKGVIHKKLSNKHVVCLDFLTPNRVNIQ